MSPDDFKAWRAAMGWTQSEAAKALGISRGSVELYERGSRREDGRPVAIPQLVTIACRFIVGIKNDIEARQSELAPIKAGKDIWGGDYPPLVSLRKERIVALERQIADLEELLSEIEQGHLTFGFPH